VGCNIMFKTILIAELKSMTRDKLYAFFTVYPAIFGTIGYFICDMLRDDGNIMAANLVAMMLIVVTGYVFGALIAFSLLDDKDDKVLMSLKITPVDVRHYILIKMLVGFVFGFIATLVLLLATNFLPDASIWVILAVSVLGAIQVPSVVLIVNSFSDNKVEGFVIMKLSAMIILFPLIGFFVTGGWQYLLGIAPGYWAGRIVELELVATEEGSALIVFLAGVLYNVFATWVLMKFYTKRSNI
jgi:fluoroquinolone transport system permease protein